MSNKFRLMCGEEIVQHNSFVHDFHIKKLIEEDQKIVSRCELTYICFVHGGMSEGWRIHPNGGGWVYKDATVDETVYVGDGVVVRGGEVRDHVVLLGRCFITGYVVIRDLVVVMDQGLVMDHARLSGRVIVRGGACIKEHAQLIDNAIIEGNATIGGYTVCGGVSHIGSSVKISGNHTFMDMRTV